MDNVTAASVPDCEEDEGALRRTSVTLPADIMEMGQRRAAAERRSFSKHLTWLIERDARRAGLIPSTEAVPATAKRESESAE